MDKETLITLLKYYKNLLVVQKECKIKYRKLELAYHQTKESKYKIALTHSVQAQLRNAMRETHRQIAQLRSEILKFN